MVDYIKGWKTLGFAVALAFCGVLQAFDWTTVIPQDKGWTGVAMIAVGTVIAVLRYVTTTPIGTK
jgi:hypothetical protein